jgi:hypothetical protein
MRLAALRSPATAALAATGVAAVAALTVAGWRLAGGTAHPRPDSGGTPVVAASRPAPATVSAASPSASPSPTQTSPIAASTPPTGAARPAGTAPAKLATVRNFHVTMYAARDNTPPGSLAIAYPAVAYPTVHKQGGGVGSYRDPITLATDRTELAVGTIVYYPYLKRYFVMEDDCTACDEDWTGDGPNGGPGYPHIDLWTGAALDSGVVDCERALTQEGGVPVILDPPATLPAVTTPLYDGDTCYRP